MKSPAPYVINHMDDPSRTPGPLLMDQRRGPAVRGLQRPWRSAVLVSVGFHLLLVALSVLLVRSKPADPGPNPSGTVELLMVERRGSGPAEAPKQPESRTPPSTAAAASTPSSPPPASGAKDTVPGQTTPAAPPPPDVSDAAGEPLPPAAQAAPEEANRVETLPPPESSPHEPAKVAETLQAEVAPPPPRQEVPVFNLEGTDSESNAIVLGNQVIPAAPDDRFRNRPPVFPYDAAMRGEHGAVLLVIHVSEYGVSTGADVAATSGIASLDQAALNAVRKWHFRPAMKEGRAVPFDMPMRFIFDTE